MTSGKFISVMSLVMVHILWLNTSKKFLEEPQFLVRAGSRNKERRKTPFCELSKYLATVKSRA